MMDGKKKVMNCELKKVYYTITELAEMFDVLPSKLRFWEQEGVIKSDVNNTIRKYTAKNVEKISRVIIAHRTGFYTLHGLAEIYRGKL